VLYGSTKSFIIQFTQALQRHIRGSSVKLQALCPGFTITEFHDTPEYAGFNRGKIPRLLWLTSAQVVSESLNFRSRKRVICIPGFQYRIIGIISRNSITGFFVREIGDRLFHN
jgi:short-subunit dehydrogenase